MATLIVLAATVPALIAGPPLICHPFAIGGAKSLPWDSQKPGWDTPRTDYQLKNLVGDTISLLEDSTPVIVRMETIRRAAIYSARDASICGALVRQFKERAADKNRDAYAAYTWFDYGYLIETLKQAGTSRGMEPAAAAVSGLDGYPMIRHALELRAADHQMEFAAALVTTWPKLDAHSEHYRNAVTGAAGDPLLQSNLLSHFSERGKNISELQAYVGKMPGQEP